MVQTSRIGLALYRALQYWVLSQRRLFIRRSRTHLNRRVREEKARVKRRRLQLRQRPTANGGTFANGDASLRYCTIDRLKACCMSSNLSFHCRKGEKTGSRFEVAFLPGGFRAVVPSSPRRACIPRIFPARTRLLCWRRAAVLAAGGGVGGGRRCDIVTRELGVDTYGLISESLKYRLHVELNK